VRPTPFAARERRNRQIVILSDSEGSQDALPQEETGKLSS
jgi:hypothetical protein